MLGTTESTHVAESVPKPEVDASEPSDNNEKPAKVVWHDFHCDPILDVVLKSSDNVYFRASSHHLKRESTMSNGMLSAMPNDHTCPETAIPLDFTSDSLALFLDSYATRGVITGISHDTLDFDSVHQYHKLIHHLDCDRLRSVADTTYKQACDKWPFEWLVIASETNDIEVAKQALLRCGANRVCHKIGLSNKTALKLARQLNPEWRTSFLCCLMTAAAYSSSCLDLAWPNSKPVENFGKDVQLGFGTCSTMSKSNF